MGSYAGHDSTHYPFMPDELDEYCNVCRNTGVTQYPISVGVHRNEADPCPNGCEVGDMRVDEYGEPHYDVVQDEAELVEYTPDDIKALAAWFATGDLHQDPFYILSSHMRRRGMKSYSPPSPSMHPGRVSSDHPVMGLAEGDDRHVYPCTVPPYLVGTPIEVTETCTRVQYDYMGDSVVVRFSKSEAKFLRFAHSWDNLFTTDQLLGR